MGLTKQDFEGKIDSVRLREGDRVKAVEHGPTGTVISVGDGTKSWNAWTTVVWDGKGDENARTRSYKHGLSQDRLYLIEAAR
jgi:hypothetical protein